MITNHYATIGLHMSKEAYEQFKQMKNLQFISLTLEGLEMNDCGEFRQETFQDKVRNEGTAEFSFSVRTVVLNEKRSINDRNG